MEKLPLLWIAGIVLILTLSIGAEAAEENEDWYFATVDCKTLKEIDTIHDLTFRGCFNVTYKGDSDKKARFFIKFYPNEKKTTIFQEGKVYKENKWVVVPNLMKRLLFRPDTYKSKSHIFKPNESIIFRLDFTRKNLNIHSNWKFDAGIKSNLLGLELILQDPYWDNNWAHYNELNISWTGSEAIRTNEILRLNVSPFNCSNPNNLDIRIIQDHSVAVDYQFAENTSFIFFLANTSKGGNTSYSLYCGNVAAPNTSIEIFPFWADFEGGVGGWYNTTSTIQQNPGVVKQGTYAGYIHSSVSGSPDVAYRAFSTPLNSSNADLVFFTYWYRTTFVAETQTSGIMYDNTSGQPYATNSLDVHIDGVTNKWTHVDESVHYGNITATINTWNLVKTYWTFTGSGNTTIDRMVTNISGGDRGTVVHFDYLGSSGTSGAQTSYVDEIFVSTRDINHYLNRSTITYGGEVETAEGLTILSPVADNMTTNNVIPHIFYYQDNNDSTATCHLYYNTTWQAGSESVANNTTKTLWVVSIRDGRYDWFISCYTPSGDWYNSTETRITVDTAAPILNLIDPEHQEVIINKTGIDISYTVSDENLDSCWWHDNVTDVNTTLPNCANATMNFNLSGLRDLTLYANDTLGHESSDTNVISVDPHVEIRAYDVTNLSLLNFNLTLTNATTSDTAHKDSNLYNNTWNGTNITLGGEVTAVVSSSGFTNESPYPARRKVYFMDWDKIHNLSFYMLPLSDGITVRFHIQDITGAPLVGATVQAERIISGNYSVVDMDTSDDSGTATLFLDPDVTYKITTTYSGITDVRYIRPTQNDYVITLSVSTGAYTGYWPYSNVRWEFSPRDNLLLPLTGTLESNITSTYNLNYTITAVDSGLEYYAINITYFNGSVLFTSNVTSVTGGTIVANLSIDNATHYFAVNVDAWFKRTDQPEVLLEMRYYTVNSSATPSNVSLVYLFTHALNKDTLFHADKTENIMALIIAAFVMVLAGAYLNNGTVGAVAGVSTLGIFTYFEWFNGMFFALIIAATVSAIILRSRWR